MGVLDNDVDLYAGWIARRDRQLQTAFTTWTVTMVVAGILVLLSDTFLIMPVIPLVVALAWLAWEWGTDHWWQVRSRRVGYPVVRADLAWTAASGGTLPPGWHDSAVPGALHRTGGAWVWRPSCWVNAGLRTLVWSYADVTGHAFTPLRTVGVPPCAQLRLRLRTGETVEFVVRRPSRLTSVEDLARW